MSNETTLDTLALASRLVPADVKPLSAREYWTVSRTPEWASATSASALSAEGGLERALAERVVVLLKRRTVLALMVEQLEQSGVWTIAPQDPSYPSRMLERLGDSAPPLLHGVGDVALLKQDGLGVVGSRNVDPEGAEIAVQAGRVAASLGLPLVSGAARGVDQLSMNAAHDDGGVVVGLVADSLDRAVQRSSTRRAITDGRVCMVTPFSPKAGFTAANAMARNKLIYALSRACLVVAADREHGGTWAGAVEALRGGFTHVLSWLGDGAGKGNADLVTRGATGINDLGSLAGWLHQQPSVGRPSLSPADQLTLDV